MVGWARHRAWGWALATALAATPVRALAQEGTVTGPVRAEVMVILAHEAEGTIDAQLQQIPALRQPPFNSFHTMRLLQRLEMQLSPEEPIQVPLPNGRDLRIELERQTTDGRYRVRVSINRPGETDYLPLLAVVASPGDPFFVAGQNLHGGTLVIGVRVGERPTARKLS